jgi:hypothetical protein
VIVVVYYLLQVIMFDVYLAGMLGGFDAKELLVNVMIVVDQQPYVGIRFAVRVVGRPTVKHNLPQPVSTAAGISYHAIN